MTPNEQIFLNGFLAGMITGAGSCLIIFTIVWNKYQRLKRLKEKLTHHD